MKTTSPPAVVAAAAAASTTSTPKSEFSTMSKSRPPASEVATTVCERASISSDTPPDDAGEDIQGSNSGSTVFAGTSATDDSPVEKNCPPTVAQIQDAAAARKVLDSVTAGPTSPKVVKETTTTTTTAATTSLPNREQQQHQDEVEDLQITAMPMHRTDTSEDMLAEARYFSTLSNPHKIAEISVKTVPGWEKVKPTDVEVNQIIAGLSNQLFKVSLRGVPGRKEFKTTDVLFRIYGKDVELLYDSSKEVCIFKKLGKRGIAPGLIGEFDGGRIEEWISGASLVVAHMSKVNIMQSVATILAGFHNLDMSKDVTLEPSLNVINRWRKTAMEIYNKTEETHPSYLAMQRLELPKIVAETYKLEDMLFPGSRHNGGGEVVVSAVAGGAVAGGAAAAPSSTATVGGSSSALTTLSFCHNDVQPNNIMVTPNKSLRLIDFEYSGYNYPAFDLASYFWEMTCDYCVDRYPFFTIDPTLYPSEHTRRLFLAFYLTKRLGRNVKTSDPEVTQGLVDVERFQMANHLIWVLWSVIRSPQAPTANDFDMLHYAMRRADVYWSLKARLMAEGHL